MIRNFICIVCPNGCELTVVLESGAPVEVSGGLCKKGQAYAENEILNPMRTVSTSVPVDGGELPLVSIRLDKPIPKGKIFEFMAAAKRLRLNAPVRIGQTVLEDVCGSGANAVATKNVHLHKEGAEL